MTTTDDISVGLLDETKLNDLQSLSDQLLLAEDDFKLERVRSMRTGSMVV